MNYAYFLFLVAFNTFITEGVLAQNRFKASLMAGSNFSQIQGDQQDGYNKQGINLGISGSMILLPDLDFCAELLYNNRGASPNSTTNVRFNHPNSDISLKYADIALSLNYFFRPKVEQNLYEQSIKVGVSYGRLLKSKVEVFMNQYRQKPIEQNLAQNLIPNDFSLMFAWSYYFTPKLSFTIRHTNSLSYLYKVRNTTDDQYYKDMRPYFITAQINFDFIAPKKVLVVRKSKKARVSPLEEL